MVMQRLRWRERRRVVLAVALNFVRSSASDAYVTLLSEGITFLLVS